MVTARGAKSYVVQYRTPEGRSRRITIGRRGSPWDGLSERVGPNQVACGRVQGIDIVAFGRDQQPADIRPRRAPKEELRIDVPGDSSLERLIKVQGSRAFSDQAGHREIATATSTAMIGQDVVLSLFLGLAQWLWRPWESSEIGRPRTNPGADWPQMRRLRSGEQMSALSGVQLRRSKSASQNQELSRLAWRLFSSLNRGVKRAQRRFLALLPSVRRGRVCAGPQG
jgi:hypothetical protein